MEFGFTGWNITSYNTIMPIIYYVYNNGNIKDENVKLENILTGKSFGN